MLLINDLPLCLLQSNIVYADDTIINTTESEWDCIVTEIQEDLKRVEQWVKNSNPVLYHDDQMYALWYWTETWDSLIQDPASWKWHWTIFAS